jgi:hypothetical protein
LDVPCLGHPEPRIVAGYFDYEHLGEMAVLAVRITDAGSGERRTKGVYFSLNPVAPSLHRRMPNVVRAVKRATRDRDIVRRRLLMVDADPVRPEGDSATEAEKDAAREVIQAIRDYLRGLGWPEPILTDSGNGFHLLYRIDLPADDGGLVRGVVYALAAIFSTDRVDIDRKVHNRSRIAKLPGTWARKGTNSPERPPPDGPRAGPAGRTAPGTPGLARGAGGPGAKERHEAGDSQGGPTQPASGSSSDVTAMSRLDGLDPPIRRVLSRLRDASPSGPTGTEWAARCPAHEDTKASLSVGLAEDGRVLLHCHAGCDWRAIVAALGLAGRAFFPTQAERLDWMANKPPAEAPPPPRAATGMPWPARQQSRRDAATPWFPWPGI